MSVAFRQAVERSIVRQAVIDLLAISPLSVNDGAYESGEETLRLSRDVDAIMSALFTTDEDTLVLIDGRFVVLVYGNDGHDVISDYTASLEKDLQGALRLADEIEAGRFDIVALAPALVKQGAASQAYDVDTGALPG